MPSYLNEECQVIDFISNLFEKDSKQIFALIDLISTKGSPHNETKFRNLGDQIYELKTRGGVRVLSFFAGPLLPRSLILTHGFFKPGSRIAQREKKKAVDWHKEYSEIADIKNIIVQMEITS